MRPPTLLKYSKDERAVRHCYHHCTCTIDHTYPDKFCNEEGRKRTCHAGEPVGCLPCSMGFPPCPPGVPAMACSYYYPVLLPMVGSGCWGLAACLPCLPTQNLPLPACPILLPPGVLNPYVHQAMSHCGYYCVGGRQWWRLQLCLPCVLPLLEVCLVP